VYVFAISFSRGHRVFLSNNSVCACQPHQLGVLFFPWLVSAPPIHCSAPQFRYGDDGLDPLEMEADDAQPVRFDHTFAHVLHTTPAEGLPGLLPHQVVRD
jgi:hypothetical protein